MSRLARATASAGGGRHEVLIPVVEVALGAGAAYTAEFGPDVDFDAQGAPSHSADPVESGCLVRVMARAELPPPHPAGLDPVIAELNDIGLYQAGQTGWAALRRCGQKRGGWLAARSVSLGVANPGDVTGLDPANARSAELGLALALALGRAASPLPEVIATGALDAGGRDPQIPVLPIAHLDRKLALIAAEFRQPGAAPVPPLLLVPCTEPDGTPVETRHGAALAALQRLGIRIQPVATLAEALAHLRARQLARHPAERLVKAAGATALALALAAGGGWVWVNQPITAHFLPVTLPEGTAAPTPLRVRLDASGRPEALTDCPAHPATTNRLATGESLAIRFATTPHGPAQWLGTRAAVVAVGSATGVKVPMTGSAIPGSFPPEMAQSFIIDIVDPAQDNLLAILLRPGRSFDLAALEARLQARLGGLDPAVRLSAAENLLRTLAPGILLYRFTTTGQEPACG